MGVTVGVASDEDEEVGVTDTVVGDVLCGELEAARDVPFEPEGRITYNMYLINNGMRIPCFSTF